MLALNYAQRALRAIADRAPMDQLDILRMYVEQGERDMEQGLVSNDELNTLRRKFISIFNDIYHGRLPA